MNETIIDKTVIGIKHSIKYNQFYYMKKEFLFYYKSGIIGISSQFSIGTHLQFISDLWGMLVNDLLNLYHYIILY